MSDYQYDVFFSYKRDRRSDAWHAKVKDLLEYWLKKELAPDQNSVSIFLDTEEIKTGDRWSARIGDSLKAAKCLVAIWSPDYFQSKWCVSEWLSFVERENRLNLTHGGIIVPASYHDGERFPLKAKAYQIKDFAEYASTMSYFWNTEAAFQFEKVLRTFVEDLAAKIRNAPPYQDSFPVVEAAPNQIEPEPVIQRVADST